MGRALLIIITGFMVIFGNVRYNLQKAGERSTDTTIKAYETQIAQNIAASGVNVAMSQLRQDFSWRAGYDSVSFGGGYYSVGVQDTTSVSDLDYGQVRVISVGHYANTIDSAVVTVEKIPFCRYSKFYEANSWWLVTGDTFTGPLHTNGKFRLKGTPVFYGKVTSCSTTYEAYDEETNPQFLGGYEFGVPPITLDLPLDELEAAADEGGMYTI